MREGALILDFNWADVRNGERGRQLVGAAKEFSVKAPLAMSEGRELSVVLPEPAAPPSPLKDLMYFRQVGTGSIERWYGNIHIQANTLTTGAPAVNTLFAYPYVSGRGGVLDRIAFNVTTGGGAGSKARVGIYTAASETDLYPRQLVVDGGEYDSTATGVKSTVISVALAPAALYWLVYLCGTAAPTVRGLNQSSIPCILGIDSGLGSNLGAGLSVAQTYGALPGFFPPGGAVLTAAPHPLVAVRYSG